MNRIYAAFKFFLYTFIGSVLMLVAMVVMYRAAGTTDIEQLLAFNFVRAAALPGMDHFRRHADAAVPGLLRQLRGENADVASAVAGCRMRTFRPPRPVRSCWRRWCC